jgi:hypothetical protein
MPILLGIGFLLFVAFLAPLKVTLAASSLFILCLVIVKVSTTIIAGADVTFRDCAKGVGLSLFFLAIAVFTLISFSKGSGVSTFTGATGLALLAAFFAAYAAGFAIALQVNFMASLGIAAIAAAASVGLTKLFFALT